MNIKNNKYIRYLKKYEFLLTSFVVFIFVIFLTVKLLLPNLMKAREIHNNIGNIRQKLARLEQKEMILAKMDETLIRNNFAKLNYVVPESKDYALLFTTLDHLQSKLGVSITRTDFELGNVSTSASVLKRIKAGDSFAVPVSFEVVGTIEQIQEFLASLSDLSGRLIIVDSIKIEVMEGIAVKATIAGKTFFNPLPKTIGSVDSSIPEFNESYKVIFDRIIQNQFPIAEIEEANKEVPVGKDNLFL